MDFLRIYCITQMLLQRLLYETFKELKNNSHVELPDHLKKDLQFNAMLLFLPAAALTAAVKLGNIRAAYREKPFPSFESYLFAGLSCPRGLMLLELLAPLVRKIDNADQLSPVDFAFIAVPGFILVALLYYALTFPDNANEYTWNPPYPKKPANLGHRILNGTAGIGYWVLSVGTFLFFLNRRINNGTTAATSLEMMLLLLGTIAAAIFSGSSISDHPGWFTTFVRGSRFLYSATAAAMMYDDTIGFFATKGKETTLSHGLYDYLYVAGWLLFSVAVGLQAMLTTLYNFEGGFEANEKILGKLKCAINPSTLVTEEETTEEEMTAILSPNLGYTTA